MEEDIRVFKLTTGEDIVAYVVDEAEESIYIKEPLLIKRIPDISEGKINIYFMIWGELKDESEPIYINPKQIVSYYWLNEKDHMRIKQFIDNQDVVGRSLVIN